MKEQDHEGEEVDRLPWEQPGHFRRDIEPYQGYAAHSLAWVAVVCAPLGLVFPLLAILGLVVSRLAWDRADRDIDRMRQGVLDPMGRDSALRAIRVARWAGVGSAAALLIWVSSCITLAVLISR